MYFTEAHRNHLTSYLRVLPELPSMPPANVLNLHKEENDFFTFPPFSSLKFLKVSYCYHLFMSSNDLW